MIPIGPSRPLSWKCKKMVASVCLIVLGIVGQFCYSPAYPIGECTEMNHDQHLCTVEANALPLFVSVYDYAICDTHPINCFGDGSRFANGVATGPEWYEIAAACPAGWTGSTLAIPAVFDYDLRCMDRGGRVHPQFRQVWTFEPGNAQLVWLWVIVVDVLYPHHLYGWPEYALQVYPDWQRTEP